MGMSFSVDIYDWARDVQISTSGGACWRRGEWFILTMIETYDRECESKFHSSEGGSIASLI